jgi:hypothetical protein
MQALAKVIRGFFALENAFAFLVKDALINQIIDPAARLEGWVELDHRIWPEQAQVDALIDVFSYAFV